MVRHLKLSLGALVGWSLACASTPEYVEPPDERHLWTVINAMVLMDWGAGYSLEYVSEKADSLDERHEGSFLSAECPSSQTMYLTSTGIECVGKYADVTREYVIDAPDLEMDLTLQRYLDEDESCPCVLGAWDGWGRMRGQITENDDGRIVIIFTADMDVRYVYPKYWWDRYHRDALAAEPEVEARSRSKGADVDYWDTGQDQEPVEPGREDVVPAEKWCEVKYEAVTATYTLYGNDLIGTVTGTPTATCVHVEDDLEFEVICDWFNVDVTDEEAMEAGCRYVGVDDD